MFIEFIDRSTNRERLIHLNNVESVSRKVSTKADHEHDYIVLHMISGNTVSVNMTYDQFIIRIQTKPVSNDDLSTPSKPDEISGETIPEPRHRPTIGGGSQEIG